MFKLLFASINAFYVYIIVAAGYSCSKTPLYIVIATTEDKVITGTEKATFSGDTYEEVQIPPSSSKDQNYENLDNRNSCQYDELQHDRKDEDEHNYQSLQKTT